ncbi:unnamed protein product [Gongylonema pulchrum]|uniref:Secreted protein n=1 Tax=Gongylonema pulchrum TaxID=637853 RepID=A0A183EBE8_9BILA|nr:unnamed protein product [Gongylonema pulchrum]
MGNIFLNSTVRFDVALVAAAVGGDGDDDDVDDCDGDIGVLVIGDYPCQSSFFFHLNKNSNAFFVSNAYASFFVFL